MTRYVLAAACAAAVLAVPAPASATCADATAAHACVTAYYTDGHFCVIVRAEALGQPVATLPCR